jgi:hypothetical protein
MIVFSGDQKRSEIVGTVLETFDHAFSRTIRNPEMLRMCK